MMYSNSGSNQRAQQIGFGGLSPFVKIAAAGIGLASESIREHKQKKNAKMATAQNAPQAQSERQQGELYPPSMYSPSSVNSDHREQHSASEEKRYLSEEEGDEEQWALDDAQDELLGRQPVNPKKRPFARDPRQIAQLFIDDYPVPPGLQPRCRLNLPVVLPQRRPKDRSRGFIRAYAPELMNAAIDQAMFLDFLETFNLATQASPWINAINMAGLALLPLHLAPGIGQAATVALYVTVQVMKNMQSRKRYHTVMDQMNEQFFQPRGLYAMVLTWNPETDATSVGINLNETISKNITPPEGIAKVINNYKPSMGSTSGVIFPETAHLVFPALDKLEDDNSEAAKGVKNKIKDAQSFASGYFDRRAQAKYAAKNPDSQLVVGPKPTFTSRYADPNDPTNSGDMLALLTAGKLSMPQRGGFGRGPGGGYGRGYGRGIGGGFGGLGSMMDYRNGRGMVNASMDQEQLMMEQQQQQQTMNQMHPIQARNMMAQQQMQMNQMNAMQMRDQGVMGGVQVGFGGTNLIADGVRRIIRHHVLYLLIVNMPTEDEMSDATLFMEQEGAELTQP